MKRLIFLAVLILLLFSPAYAQSNIDEKIEEFKKIIATNPNDAVAHNNLGIAYLDNGMVDKAILQLKKAIAIDPNDAVTHYNLGVAYKEKRMFDKAILQFKRAIAIDPNDADTHIDLGTAYEEKGILDKAILHFKKAIALVRVRPHVGEPLATRSMEEFKVNLSGEERYFIRTIIALGYPKDEEELSKEIGDRMSEIRHIIFLTLSGKRIDELDSREEKERFLEEIRIEINKRLRSPVKIQKIFIHDMVFLRE